MKGVLFLALKHICIVKITMSRERCGAGRCNLSRMAGWGVGGNSIVHTVQKVI